MANKHTPAPWVISLHGNYIENESKFKIARVSGFANSPNAKLIAAAPDLLEALIDVLDAFERHSSGYSKGYELNTVICGQAKNAVAKATGETQ